MTTEVPHSGGAVGPDSPAPGRALRAVVLARPSAANRYLFDAVSGTCEMVAVLTDIPKPRPARSARQRLELLRRAPLTNLTKPGRRAVLRRIEARLDREIRAALPRPHADVFAGVQRLTAVDLNGDRGVQLLRDLDPDVLILSGAPLLKSHVYGIPRLGTINLHWGIAPDYRGQQSIFTALRRRDYGAIGMTIHYLDDGVDTGPVLAQGWPSLDPGDTLATLWAKTALAGATMLGDLLEGLRAGPVAGEGRPGPGIVVRSRDRRVRHHVHHFVDRAVLRRRPPMADGRIVRYWTPRAEVRNPTVVVPQPRDRATTAPATRATSESDAPAT